MIQNSGSIIVIYPGTFDPVTYGHLDIMRRASRLFSKVVVGVANPLHKRPMFTIEERIEMIRKTTEDIANLEVDRIDGLLVDFAKKHRAKAVLRGLRAVSDFEYEFKMAWANRRLLPELETLFLIPSERCAYISSSLVREIAFLGGDVSQFVPPYVVKKLEIAVKRLKAAQSNR